MKKCVLLNARRFLQSVMHVLHNVIHKDLPVLNLFIVMALLKLISWSGSMSVIVWVISEGRQQGEYLVFICSFKRMEGSGE
jgi:D-arabinose 5-phosphate isomerase GutQ